MANQLHTALVGCGGISGAHLPNIRNTPEMRLVATMDVVEAAAQRRAEEINAAYYTTDWQRILDDDTIEAVLLCSTHNTHTALAIEALAAGKHVYSEKPLAMTLDEARRLQQAVHESGLQLMSGWWFKHSPVTKRLREVIPQPYFILFTCRLASSRYDNARPNDPEGPYGRNGILDAAGYNLHWIWHVMRSQPVEVTATGYEGAPTNTSTITIRFANGSIGTSIYSVVGAGGILPKHYAEVLAGGVSAATLRFGNLVFEGTDEPGIEHNTYHNGFDEEMGMFAHLCLHGGPSPMDAWEACIPTLIFEKAVESMRTHQPVPVDVREDFYLPDGKLPASIEHFGD
jgi:predicted dehydrogenase